MITFDEADVELHSWPVHRCAGGQHLNSCRSGVLAIHKPTGLAIVCTTERSQHSNRTRAITRLRRLFDVVCAECDQPLPRCTCEGVGPCLVAACPHKARP